MAIKADPVTPPDIGVEASRAGSKDPKPKDATLIELKPLPGVSASPIDRVAAGVDLSKFVLWIVVGTLVGLWSYLIFMDMTIASNVSDSYKSVFSAGPVGAELRTVEKLKLLSTELTAARDKPEAQLTPGSYKFGEELVADIASMPSLATGEGDKLARCLPPPSGDSRSQTIADCLSLLNDLRSGIMAQSSSVAHAQAAADAANKINEQRQNFHLFWMQAAQLVLLNLLLPLLTAILGYIFGTQQGSQAAK